jgi:anti-sigma B factor antagonist
VYEILASGRSLRRLAVAGEIDILTSPDLARFLRHHLDDVKPGSTVAVDLSRVGLLSAVGIGVLVQTAQAARRNGVRLVVGPVSPQVRRVLALSGVHLTSDR